MCRATLGGRSLSTGGASADWAPPTNAVVFHPACGPPLQSKTFEVSTVAPWRFTVGIVVYGVVHRMKWWLPGV